MTDLEKKDQEIIKLQSIVDKLEDENRELARKWLDLTDNIASVPRSMGCEDEEG